MSSASAVSAVPGAAAPNGGAPAQQPNGGAPAAQPGAQQPAAPWYGDIPDVELKGWTETKAPKAALDALKGWRDSEKLLGVPKDQLLRLPSPTADQKTRDEAMGNIWKALGRPDAPEGYQIPSIEGDEDSAKFTAAMKPILHGIGLTQPQALQLKTAWDGYIKSQVEEQDRVQAQQEQVDVQNLHKEWPGEVFTQREEMARRAVQQFVNPMVGNPGEAAELLGQLEDAIGTSKFLKLFSNIGEKLSEGRFIGGERPSTFGMTPAQAHNRIVEMRSDRATAEKMMIKGSTEFQEFERLSQIAAQGR
jgi:hypothetical protein